MIKEQWFNVSEKFPDDGELVTIFTDKGRKIPARYEKFLDSELWETDHAFSPDEKVLAWKR